MPQASGQFPLVLEGEHQLQMEEGEEFALEWEQPPEAALAKSLLRLGIWGR